MDIALHSIIDCEPLPLQLYEGIFFVHVMSKTYQYAMNDDKVYVNLTLVNVTNLPKLICKIKYLKKNQRKGGMNGKTLHWEWDVTSKVEDSNENQICE